MKKMNISMEVQPKTIYSDIVDMPDPMFLGTTIHYYNHSDITLYMKIFGSGPTGWSSNSVALGSLSSGSNAYINLDNFLSRTKPSGARTETLTIILRGYTDSGYTDLFAEFSRTVTVIFIKSDDGTWTTDFSNNFDDGTVQGWSGSYSWDSTPGPHDPMSFLFEVATDYVLSTPYSLKTEVIAPSHDFSYFYIRLSTYKAFAIPSHATVYAIFNVRFYTDSPGIRIKYLDFLSGDTILTHLGTIWTSSTSNDIPISKWMRIVIPVSSYAGTTITLKIRCLAFKEVNYDGISVIQWLDDFKIISK